MAYVASGSRKRAQRNQHLPERLGAIAWWDPTYDPSITMGTGVAKWVDRIGGVELLQGTPGNQPARVSSARLGHTALSFSSDSLIGGIPSQLQTAFESQHAHTVYTESVLAAGTGAGTKIMFSAYDTADNGAENVSYQVGGGSHLSQSSYAGAGTTLVRNGTTLPDLAARWGYTFCDGTVYGNSFLGGSETSSTINAASPTGLTDVEIGGRDAANYYDGELGHVIIFDRALTAGEHAQMQAWMELQWAHVPAPLRLGAAHWWDPTILTPEAYVSSWVDSLGGVDIVQASGVNQPYATSLFSFAPNAGHQMLGFGSNDFMRADSAAVADIFNNSAPHKIYLEVVPTDSPDGRLVFFSVSDGASALINAELVREGSGEPQYRYRDSGADQSLTASWVTPLLPARWVSAGLNDSDEITVGEYGQTEEVLARTRNPTTLDRITIGARGDDSADPGASIGHIVIFPRDLHSTDAASMEAWLEGLWAHVPAPLRLGATHWWDPTDDSRMVTATGVSDWTDRISGEMVSSAVGTEQPTKVQSIRTGHQMLDFDSSFGQQLVQAGAAWANMFNDGNNFSAFVESVGDYSTPATSARLGVGNNGDADDYMRIRGDGGNSLVCDYRDVGGLGPAWITNNYRSFRAEWLALTAGDTQIIAHSQDSSGPRARDRAPTGFDEFAIGAGIIAGSTAARMEGEIGHVVLFEREIAGVDLLSMGAWYESMWAHVPVPLRLGAVNWWDPTDDDNMVTATGVSDWTDRIGSVTVSNAVGADQPVVVPRSIRTGHQMLSFGGGNQDDLVGTDATLGALFSDLGKNQVFVEAVVAPDQLGSTGAFFTAYEAADDTGEYVELVWAFDGFANSRTVTNSGGQSEEHDAGPAEVNKAMWVTLGQDGTDSVVRAMGSVANTHTMVFSGGSGLDTIAIGGKGSAHFLEAEIGHICVFEDYMKSPDQAKMTAWLESLWDHVPAPIRLGAMEWWDPSAEWVTTVGSNISAWVGRIAGQSAVQAVDANRPQYLAIRGPHGTAAVEFEDSDKWLQLSMNQEMQEAFNLLVGTAWCGYRPTEITTLRTIWGVTDINESEQRITGGHDASGGATTHVHDDDVATAIAVVTGPLVEGVDTYHLIQHDGVSQRGITDQALGTGSNIDTVQALESHDTLTLGGRENQDVAGAVDTFRGRLYDLVFFAHVQNYDDMTTMTLFMDARIEE